MTINNLTSLRHCLIVRNAIKQQQQQQQQQQQRQQQQQQQQHQLTTASAQSTVNFSIAFLLFRFGKDNGHAGPTGGGRSAIHENVLSKTPSAQKVCGKSTNQNITVNASYHSGMMMGSSELFHHLVDFIYLIRSNVCCALTLPCLIIHVIL